MVAPQNGFAPSGVVDDLESLNKLVDIVAVEQKVFAKFTQEQIDRIFTAASLACSKASVKLAKMAVDEAGMGNLEDKTIKNQFACEDTHSAYKDMKTCGVVERDEAGGFVKYAEPVGVLAGVIPCTNPTSTTIFKALIALKTRNCIIFSPHPRTVKCSIKAARIARDAAVANGAPAHCITWLDVPTIDLCNKLMAHPKISMIVATGGPGLVKAAMSSGKPAMGGGPGNTPVIIDETADIPMAVNSVLLSKTFDNGMICSSEQSIIAVESVAQRVKDEFRKRGAYFLTEEEKRALGDVVINDKGMLIPSAVGQSAVKLAELAGIQNVPDGCRLLVGELKDVGPNEKLSYEKLCPCLGFYEVDDFDSALARGLQMVEHGGMGHTSVLYTDLNGPLKDERVSKFQTIMPTCRTLVCMPTAHGGIGNVFNFRQTPSLTLCCGSWGNNSSAESLGPKHLLNIKQISERREHFLWFRIPPSIYYNRGCLTAAVRELQRDGLKRAFIVTDFNLKAAGHVTSLMNALKECNIDSDAFFDIESTPDVAVIRQGVARMNLYKPDVVIALGGGSPMSAAKVMRLFYEHPDARLDQLFTRFMDMQKRIAQFPKRNGKVKKLVCIPTTFSTGAEMSPFAVVCDKQKGETYPVADYSLTPDMAIEDSNLVMTMPKSLVVNGGFGALVNSVESYVSMYATDYTRMLSLQSITLLFNNLEKAASGDAKARENCQNAVAIGAMATANAFVGICSSIAGQVAAAFDIPSGVAASLFIGPTVLFNAEEAPSKQGTFPQYTHPVAKQRYAEIDDALGVATSGIKTPDAKVKDLIGRLASLAKNLKMPCSMKDLGISKEALQSRVDDIALAAFDGQATGSNPRYPLVTEIKDILMSAYSS